MSAEHTTKRPAPALFGHAEPPRDQRDEKRLLLMYFGRSNVLQQCLSKRCDLAKRRDGIKDLSQRRVLSTHRLDFGFPDADVNEESCDALWSTTVGCNQFVRDVH
jgi:hypothetical protein